MQKNKYQAYAVATQTVARTKQIVMLYDGAIRFMKQAKEAIAAKRIEDRYNCLIKASSVITGLQHCLDFENGGDIAKILYSFYSRVDGRIHTIHRSNSAATCDEVIEELRKMRELWHDIDINESETAAMSTAVPVPPATPSAAMTPGAEPDKTITLSA